MAVQCIITGKTHQTGSNVSHSKRRTKRRHNVNFMKRRIFNPATQSFVNVKISAGGMRTLTKWQKEGKKFDLRKMMKEA